MSFLWDRFVKVNFDETVWSFRRCVESNRKMFNFMCWSKNQPVKIRSVCYWVLRHSDFVQTCYCEDPSVCEKMQQSWMSWNVLKWRQNLIWQHGLFKENYRFYGKIQSVNAASTYFGEAQIWRVYYSSEQMNKFSEMKWRSECHSPVWALKSE